MDPDSKEKSSIKETDLVTPNYTKLSENLRKITPQKLQCSFFCGGSHCKYENPEHWKPDDLAIQGIFSNWITEDILAMARPSTTIIVQNNLVEQFRSLGIKSIVNLQCPREHASCGYPLETSGFTYDPTIFMQSDIYYYNLAWEDYGDISLPALINMVKVLAFAITEGRVAVHCHAGLGRTGVLIASYLIYSIRISANEAIKYVRMKRPGSVQTRGQIICVRQFAHFILPLTVTFYIRDLSIKDKYMNCFTLQKYLKSQRIILHGYDERKYKYFPMILHLICERILQICGRKTEEFDAIDSKLTDNFLSTRMSETIKRFESVFSIISTLSDSALSSSLSSKALHNLDYDDSLVLKSLDQNDGFDLPKHSASFSDISDNSSTENLSLDNIFKETRRQKHPSEETIDNFVDVQVAVNCLLTNFASLGDDFKNYVMKVKKYVNSFQYGYYRVASEVDPNVLACLLFDWLESLKNPILNQEELEKIVIHFKAPEKCLKLLAMEHAILVEYILRFLRKLLPQNEDIKSDLLKRFTAALSQQVITISDVTFPTDKCCRRMREGTLTCIIEFFEGLMEIIIS